MAVYIIVTGILHLFRSDFLKTFLQFAVQLLNFAVLLSYPINFFIYCRMSRAFRDAFTRLLCTSFNSTRQERLQSIATPLLGKANSIANNNNIELKTSSMETTIHASTVIPHSTTQEIPMMSLTPRCSKDLKANSVSFSDELDHPAESKRTDM